MQRRAKVESTFARSLIDRRQREDESNLLSSCRNWPSFVQYFKCTPDADGIRGILIIFIPSLTTCFVLISFNVRQTALGGTRIYLDFIKPLFLLSREIVGEITAPGFFKKIISHRDARSAKESSRFRAQQTLSRSPTRRISMDCTRLDYRYPGYLALLKPNPRYR